MSSKDGKEKKRQRDKARSERDMPRGGAEGAARDESPFDPKAHPDYEGSDGRAFDPREASD